MAVRERVAKWRATVTDLARVSGHGKAELVEGRVILMSPTGGVPGRAGGKIYRSLDEYEEQGGGYAFPDNVGFLVDLPNRHSFSPDAAFYAGPLPIGGEFLTGAPLFAAEVRSENDYGPQQEREIAQKRADYFATGTRVVWDVDVLRAQEICSYRADAPETPRIFRRGEVADAEPALPDWSFPVNDLFPRQIKPPV